MAKIKATGGIKITGQLRAGRFNIPPEWDTIAGSLGTPFESQAFTVTPGATDPDTFPDLNITYSIVSETGLPSGLILNTSTSEISGTPDAVGSDTLSSFTLRAADGSIGANKPGKFDERDFNINVIDDNPPTFDIGSLGLGSVAESQNTTVTIPTITATDPNTVTQTITFSEVTNTLTNENLSINTNTGVISGVPGTVGGTRTLAFTLRASTPTNSADKNYEIIVTDAQDPVWVTAVGLLATVDESVAISTITLEATDDNTVNYTITSGALPDGLSLSLTGDITGTPDNVAEDTTFDFEVTATDTVELDFTARCFSIKVLNLIANSLRFNVDDSAYLSQTLSSGNRTTWTFSTWYKRGKGGITEAFFAAGSDGNNRSLINIINDSLQVFSRVGGIDKISIDTDMLFRDHSAWYHIVVVLDTGNGTASDRIRIYVNGLRPTVIEMTLPNLDYAGNFWGNGALHTIARAAHASNSFVDGYLAETIFVDGIALEPTSFGAFDANGDWQPKGYSGAFGTNGFHLDYAVAPGTGNGGGTDVSGNANHFADSGLAANDQVPDSPTSNFAVLNPLQLPSNVTLSDGNLTATGSSTGWKNPHATFLMDKNAGGKYYFEVTSTATGTDEIWWGIIPEDETVQTSNGTTNGHNTINRRGTNSYRDSVVQDSGLTALGNGETGMCAIDLDNEKIWFGREGTWDAGGDPATNTGGISLFVSKDLYYIVVAVFESRDLSVDFGQLGYTETKPTGFDSINSANLPTPTIADPSDYFNTILYTGNATASTDITGLDFQPDLVWIKNRSQADEHKLIDAVRSATKELNSDDLNNESTDANGLTTFNSDGFELGTGAGGYNDTGESFVAWNWIEGSTPGFDIVSYTGNGTNQTVGHSLDVVPDLMIVKGLNLDSVKGWRVYHSANTSAPETDHLVLNTTAATVDTSNMWNDTAPTSSVFTVGLDSGVNADTKNYIAYLWAEVEGFSRFGSYTGNGSTDGPFIWCGFRPAWLMIKSSSVASTVWLMHDVARKTFNVDNTTLQAESSGAEGTSSAILVDILSNGFKIRGVHPGGHNNNNGASYVFMVFAESPFKTARAR